jgi:hypothetical protein
MQSTRLVWQETTSIDVSRKSVTKFKPLHDFLNLFLGHDARAFIPTLTL